MKPTTLCECGHTAAEHTPRPGGGVLSKCQHDVRSTVRKSCTCKAFGAARICAGCGGDGIAYAVSDRRRQIARRSVGLFKESTFNGTTSRGVSEIDGVLPVANPFIEAIRRLESRVSQGYRLDHDIHTYVAHDADRDGFIEDRETPRDLPTLTFAAFGIWPDEMCQSCYGTGRALSQRFPDLARKVDRMDASLRGASC
jgi:hypothetical protein